MIIYAGNENDLREFQELSKQYEVKFFDSVEDPGVVGLIPQTEAFLIGPGIIDPAKEVQKIVAADKQLSIIVLTKPAHIKQVKQNLQFSPFVGNNTLVVALNPELDIRSLCSNAITRTRQKRNFQRLNIASKDLSNTGKKAKLTQMGAFLEYAPIAAILLNDANHVVNYNRQAKHYFPSLEFIDIDLTSIMSSKDAALIIDFLHNDHAPEACKELQLNRKIFELTTTEVYDEEGSRHSLLLFNDVTDHRLEMKRIEAILESIPQMAFTTDAAGNATYFTQGWFFYTGQTKEEALGTGWAAVVAEDDKERLTTHWNESVASGKPFQQAAKYRNAKGDYRWHLARASAIRDNNTRILMWVGTCTDIHDQVMLTEELERKVSERTKSLEITNSELEQFAHVSSHDLQEPLRKIRTFAELLRTGVYDQMDETSKRYLDKISSTAERMSSSLKALLNFTRLRKEEKFTEVNLNDIVAHVLIDLELMISQKKAIIDVAQLPTIKASPIQMQQLFYNLLNNALKFSDKDQVPHVTIYCRQLMEEELTQFPQLQHFQEYFEITLKDNGIGFDEQYADKIFTIFQRLHSKSEYEGTGIGLSLVKKVVYNHKGEIYVRSKMKQGTTFYIILPAS